MTRSILVLALAACSAPPPHAAPKPPPPARAVDPALAALVRSVGANSRAPSRGSTWRKRSVGGQLENLDMILASVGGKSLAACKVTVRDLRLAVGEPLRIAAEIDGNIDTARLPCLLGEHFYAMLGDLGVLVTDRHGGIAISRATVPGNFDLDAWKKLRGRERLAVELGPRDHRVDFAISFGDPLRFAITGADLGKLAAATEAMFGPGFAIKQLHGDAHGLSGELARDADPSWAADFKAKLVEAFKIPSSSMRPTLVEGDHIFAVKGALAAPIVPGDVIVYRTAEDRTYVKRVIATGGQMVTETAAGIAIDGARLPITVVDPARKFYEEDPERGVHIDRVGALVRETIGGRSYLTLRTGPARAAREAGIRGSCPPVSSSSSATTATTRTTAATAVRSPRPMSSAARRASGSRSTTASPTGTAWARRSNSFSRAGVAASG